MSLAQHLARGITTTCLAWAVTRKDGVRFGFTDHDCDLTFDGMVFRAGSGMSAGALQQSTGLSVDNAEAVGALSDACVTEADLRAGRFDGAGLQCWQVNWADPGERALRFSGFIGEVSHGAGGFRAELRGLTEALNRPQGRVIQPGCDAALGDLRCRMDLGLPGYRGRFVLQGIRDGQGMVLRPFAGFEAGWFERGTCRFLSGAARGLTGWVKSDRIVGADRLVELWTAPGAEPMAGDEIELTAGCDKRVATCRAKFNNLGNFRGFPDVPSEDWLTAAPQRSAG